MNHIVILFITLTVLTLLIIQTITIRISLHQKLIISIDYMFFTFYYTVKKGKKTRTKKYITPLLSFSKEILSHSSVTLHKAIISYQTEDYADECIKNGAIRSILFPTLSAIRAFSKEFTIDDSSIETKGTTGETDAPHFEISIKTRLYHIILSSFSFLKSYLNKKLRNKK